MAETMKWKMDEDEKEALDIVLSTMDFLTIVDHVEFLVNRVVASQAEAAPTDPITLAKRILLNAADNIAGCLNGKDLPSMVIRDRCREVAQILEAASPSHAPTAHKPDCPVGKNWIPSDDGYTGTVAFDCTCGPRASAPPTCPQCGRTWRSTPPFPLWECADEFHRNIERTVLQTSCKSCGSNKRDGYISYDATGRHECDDPWHAEPSAESAKEGK